jgi:hypothetical protein
MNNNSTPIRRVSFLPHIEVKHQEEFYPFGARLLFKTNHLELLETAQEAFGRFPMIRETSDNPLIITLLVTDKVKASKVMHRIDPRYYTKGNYFHISLDKDNLAVADIAAGVANGFLTTEIVEDRPYVRYIVIESLLQAMLGPSRKYFSIHAAGIKKNGVSLILQGKAGSGKSTLAYACLRHGYQLLAEDVVHVKFRNGENQLWGSPWKFHLLPDAVQFFPELNSLTPQIQLNGESKLEIEIEDYYPGSSITHAEPGLILLVTRNPDLPATIKRVPAEDAAREFEVIWPWEVGWTAEHEKASLSLLQNGIFRLYTGKNIFESLSLIDEFVENVTKSEIQDLPYATQTSPEITRVNSHITRSRSV